MNGIPPEVDAYFAAQRKQQQQYVTTARIGKTLGETTRVALQVMDKIALRGVAMSESVVLAEDLQESSRTFVVQVLPWWRRCLPRWWWCP